MILKTLDVVVDYKGMNRNGSDYQPTLQVYVPNTDDGVVNYMPKKPMVLVCPGGSYKFTSDREVEPIAMFWLSKGYGCAVLRYSCSPSRFPVQLAEAGKALLMIKENAEEWLVDTDRIYVMGFSAGGHLAASLGVFWNKPFLADILGVESNRLKFNSLILSYPVISSDESVSHAGSIKHLLGTKEKYDDEDMRRLTSLELQVDEQTPRSFIWHTSEDGAVPVQNSLLFALALRNKGVPIELHIYEHGKHGLSTGTKVCCTHEYRLKAWLETCYEWLEENAELDKQKEEQLCTD